jgi:diguanylate cyclase (GGDEF)-like protein
LREEGDTTSSSLGVYVLLSRLGFPKSYQGKIMLVMFVGIYAPLVVVLFYLLVSSQLSLRPTLQILVLLVCTTLFGTGVALYALKSLLAPVRLASASLREYLDSQRLPDLPIGFADGAGRLMADVQYALNELDTTIRSLEGLSGTDPLTGLLNRRAAEKRLAEDAARVRGGRRTLTIGVVDLNNFKAINDTYGHEVGDVCIRHVAEVIWRNIRESDWLARWGGDEFVLALHEASPFAATELVLQRIVRDLKDSPVRVSEGVELVLTLTIGARRYSGEADLRELVAKADEALYEAKREERPWILSR